MTDERIYEVIMESSLPDEVASKLGIPKREFNKELDKKLEASQERAFKLFTKVAKQSNSFTECQTVLTLAAGFARRGAEEDMGEVLEENEVDRIEEIIEDLMDEEGDILRVLHLLSEAVETILFMQEQHEQMYLAATEYFKKHKETTKLKVIENINKELKNH